MTTTDHVLTPREAYDQHVAALVANDLDAIVAGYAEDAVIVHPDGGGRGHDAIRKVFSAVPDVLEDLQPEVDVIVYDEVVLAVWRSAPPDGPHRNGADTFVVRDGLIVVHTGTGTG